MSKRQRKIVPFFPKAIPLKELSQKEIIEVRRKNRAVMLEEIRSKKKK